MTAHRTAPAVTTIAECRAAVAAARAAGRTIGFVPTMGALHAGHRALVELARESADWVVLSIFVNPLQFGPAEDFDAYPRDLEADLAEAARWGLDLVFAPTREELVPQPPATTITMQGITDEFEGARRPGHFEGVLTVVAKLFHIVAPDVAVFGRKDAQQAAAIRRMVADLNIPVRILVHPTVREADGLACSSRNAYLSSDERSRGLALSRALMRAEDLVAAGETHVARIESAMKEIFEEAGIEVEYSAIVDPDRFTRVERLAEPAVAAIAVRVGKTRLIDAIVLDPDGV